MVVADTGILVVFLASVTKPDNSDSREGWFILPHSSRYSHLVHHDEEEQRAGLVVSRQEAETNAGANSLPHFYSVRTLAYGIGLPPVQGGPSHISQASQ